MKANLVNVDKSLFQQITLSDIGDQLGDERIYSKIDNVTIMFKDCKINDVLKFIKCDGLISEFFQAWFETYSNQSDIIQFNYNGCRVEVRKGYLYGMQHDVNIFFRILPEIRLELTGTGLDFLRSIGIIPETYFRDPIHYPGERSNFHLTRIDFAFDLINYAPELIDTLIKHINEQKTDTDRLVIYGKSSSLVYKIKTGGEKTVYLGSTSSQRMLRIYDKRLQYVDRRTGTYVKDNPYSNPDSWIRIEMQCRKDIANQLCFAENMNMESIFKYIYENYCFAIGTTTYNRVPCEWWSKLLDWSKIPRIIQNFDKVQYKDPRVAAVDSFYSRNMSSYLLTSSILDADYGKEGMNNLIYDYLSFVNSSESESALRIKNSILIKAETYGLDLSGINPGLFTYKANNGMIMLGYRTFDKIIYGLKPDCLS